MLLDSSPWQGLMNPSSSKQTVCVVVVVVGAYSSELSDVKQGGLWTDPRELEDILTAVLLLK